MTLILVGNSKQMKLIPERMTWGLMHQSRQAKLSIEAMVTASKRVEGWQDLGAPAPTTTTCFAFHLLRTRAVLREEGHKIVYGDEPRERDTPLGC